MGDSEHRNTDVGSMWVPPRKYPPSALDEAGPVHQQPIHQQSIHQQPERNHFGRVIAVLALIGALVLGFGVARDRVELSWLPERTSSPGQAAAIGPPPPPPLDVNAVAAVVNPTLVNIDVVVGPLELQGAGTGIVLTPDGQILTSHHVIKGAVDISVTDVANGLIYDATPVGYDSSHDVALLQLSNAASLPTARIGDSKRVRLGDEVVAIGNAGGVGGTPTSAPGKATSLESTIIARNDSDYSRKYLSDLIEVEANVVAGQSGGSLVDRSGAVIGLITAGTPPPEVEETPIPAPEPLQPPPPLPPPPPHRGYAVPINQAMAIVAQIQSGTRSDTVHIGPTATLGTLVTDPAGSEKKGAHVELAIYGTPAFEAGVTRGDVITAIDGHPIASTKQLRAELSAHLPGDSVALALTDESGSNRTVRAVLADGPPN